MYVEKHSLPTIARLIPSLVAYQTIRIHRSPFPGYNGVGEFLENNVLAVYHNRRQGHVFVRVPRGGEWYYSWHRGPGLVSLCKDLENASNTADDISEWRDSHPGQQVTPQLKRAADQAQDVLDQRVRRTVPVSGSQWPQWATFLGGNSNNPVVPASQAQQVNQTLKRDLFQAVHVQSRPVVEMDDYGILHFLNELAAVIFFEHYIHTE